MSTQAWTWHPLQRASRSKSKRGHLTRSPRGGCFENVSNTSPITWSATSLAVMDLVTFAVVVLVGPNVLRTFCLHFVSSNMHYYGDVEAGNVIQQTQVLNPWWLWPLQAFCCNFGSSHAIHHFVVKEPFYVRQLTVPFAHRVMREMGVRFNDFGTFARANRWTRRAQAQTGERTQTA